MLDRRSFLTNTACGFGALAATGLLSQYAQSANGLHLPAKAKRVIFLFMQGGVSQVDSFDYKPLLAQRDGEMVGFDDARTFANSRELGTPQRVMKSPWTFKQYGESGRWVSELFPQMAQHVDRMTMIHSMHTEGVAHGPATLFLHCGAQNFVRPSMGSWIQYGLGTENENLPGFVSISPSIGNGGQRNYGNAFLPAKFQGTAIGEAGNGPLAIKYLSRSKKSKDASTRRDDFDVDDDASDRLRWEHIQDLNRLHRDRLTQGVGMAAPTSELDAVLNSYELAFRMQNVAPELMNLDNESQETLELYGIDQKQTESYGCKCLLARRLSEAGVRYIQVNYGDNSANPAWDQHSNLPKHAEHAAAVDRPIAGLLTDLARRGLLEDTLVWWGGEFGRAPYAEKNGTGRDHNPGGFTMWLAGGGTKPGFAHGATDDFGHKSVHDKVHMHDLHATILHLLGIDHEKLTYRNAGRDFRLTDVHGRVVRELLA